MEFHLIVFFSLDFQRTNLKTSGWMELFPVFDDIFLFWLNILDFIGFLLGFQMSQWIIWSCWKVKRVSGRVFTVRETLRDRFSSKRQLFVFIKRITKCDETFQMKSCVWQWPKSERAHSEVDCSVFFTVLTSVAWYWILLFLSQYIYFIFMVFREDLWKILFWKILFGRF